MAKQHYLRFLIRDQSEDLIFEVREKDSDRLAVNLENLADAGAQSPFFWFDTVDGRSVVINLSDVQGARMLWDMSSASSDLVRYEGEIEIRLRDREEVLSEYTELPVQLFDLFTKLEDGPDPLSFGSFLDLDGEPLYLSLNDIVWIIAPAHLLAEGRSLALGESEPDI